MASSQDSEMIQLDISLQKANEQRNGFKLRLETQLPGSGFSGIFGASGSGKTTLLRCIAGLEPDSQGSVVVNQHTFQNDNVFLSPQQRNVGFVFQQPVLFPHLTAKQNIEFGAKRAFEPLSETHVNELIMVSGVEHLLTRYPASLSGGEQQRIAIVRAVASNPSILLMDEPLAALDDARKTELMSYLEALQSILAIPVLYVSHSQTEVARLAQQVLVLESGELLQQGEVTDVFNRLNRVDEQTAMTFLEGRVANYDEQYHLTQITLAQHSLWLPQSNLSSGSKVRLCIAANDISISLDEHSQTSILNRLLVKIQTIKPSSAPGISLIELNADGQSLLAQVTNKSVNNLQLKADMSVWAQIKSAAILR
ncbi:molybdenum ABC transporter ATP-binding protein [Planctobacterium marinum]|uniref:Molybdenum import ATP-binding protein ModC n=1 Tax=Planctobacterium marinum TaxID=1631968 RepID=A0AA48KNU5_9ALTE|nr:molybdenum import ATP-binding protein ModC [Planctobacterium marinum]